MQGTKELDQGMDPWNSGCERRYTTIATYDMDLESLTLCNKPRIQSQRAQLGSEDRDYQGYRCDTIFGKKKIFFKGKQKFINRNREPSQHGF